MTGPSSPGPLKVMTMRDGCRPLYVCLLLIVMGLIAGAGQARAQTAFTVVSGQPTGEIASLAEANEIRIRFSEAMIPLGRIPDEVTAPFFSVRPAIAGTFRWAGPTILVFTPDPRTPLPFATRYEVTISTAATAESGRRLDRPYVFSFTTPTVKLLRTDWHRSGSRYDQKVIIALRFNQAVRPADVLAHATTRHEPHAWPELNVSALEREQMGPVQSAQFDAKVAAARATAASNAPVPLALATRWDERRFPRAPDLVMLETTIVPAPDAWLRLTLDTRLPSPAGAATPAQVQTFVVQLEPTFFVDAFGCRSACNADDGNYARLRAPVALAALRRLTAVRDISDGPAGVAVNRSSTEPATYRGRLESVHGFTPEDLGYGEQAPARTWAYTIDGSLTALDGQTLGYSWTGVIENWRTTAFVSFGDGHGVWEKGSGPLPFSGRNHTSARQWLQPLTPDRLMPTIRELQEREFRQAPAGAGSPRTLRATPDQILAHGLDLGPALNAAGTGLAWAAIQPGATIPRSRPRQTSDRPIATIVQTTNLGITVKDSPQNTLVFVTRLDSGDPVPAADVSIVRLDNSVAWSGRTNADGIALAPALQLRDPRRSWEMRFIVTAAKDGDVAYVGSDWNEGIEPYMFGHRYDLGEAQPLLRGTVFSDRGVYKLGEEVHVKAILRRDTPSGIQLIAAGTPLYVLLKDARDKVVDQRTVTINAWSAAEWVTKLPADSALGSYQLTVSLEKDALEPATPKPEDLDDPDWQSPYRKVVSGGFLVAAYRRPEFRVDASLASDSGLAGTPLKGVVTGRYLFGAAMPKRPVKWTYTRTPLTSAPAAVLDKYPGSRFAFVGHPSVEGFSYGRSELDAKMATLDASGHLAVDLDTPASDGYPYQYTLEGDVEDVSRQRIAGRASTVVHPAPWYVGVQRPSLFVSQKDGLNTSIVAASPSGVAVPGVPVTVILVEVQYHSVRRAEGNGFYAWDTQRREAEVGRFTVITGADPVPLAIPLKNGGSYVVRATAADGAHRAITQLSFYAVGSGYTAWERYDHNRIDLVPEQERYKPGDTARLMIKSPWEQATALMTVEREGIRSHSTFRLTSTQETITVPISAGDIPNIFVSVVLIKGRTVGATSEDASDPGKPTFRIGYAHLRVEDASKRLSVSVKADRDEFRPAGSAKVDVLVNDVDGVAAASEVTLWAVDYGVLSLTGYRTPDVLGSVYVEKALQVMNTDNRQRIVSRRVLTPKGETDGGGGGAEGGVNELRKDFRVLAFWLGSVVTDARGRATTTVKLPESLTTYRIMAVAADKSSRFGSGDSEIRINKPVVLKAAFPRFLTRGDSAFFGSVVTSQLKEAGSAIVTMRSLDPDVLQIVGDTRRVVQVAAGGSTEVRFDVVAKNVGRARMQTTVRLGGESDAFEETVPVEVTVSPETVAVYGEAQLDAKQPMVMPTGIVPGFGGLRVEVSSTALVGLHEGARYVVEYPYGCAEQRASRAFVMSVASDLGEAFKLPGIDAKDLRSRTQQELKRLESYQCASGGFAYWPGDCSTVSPYLTSYVVDVYQTAMALNYQVDRQMLERAYDYLQRELASTPPVNEGWWPAFTAWESFAIKVLVEGGRNQDSNINRLYGYLDRMPVFALTYLLDAMTAKGETGARPAEIRRRIENAILPEAGMSHVEELADPYLLYFWNSNVRTTALVLSTKVKTSASPTDVVGLVRWLVASRKNGRWGNTQENAIAMKALVDYYRRYESDIPDFTATLAVGAKEIVKATFNGRTTTSTVKDVPMAQLAAMMPSPGASSTPSDILVRKDGTGTAFFNARLTYAADAVSLTSADRGFRIERRYAVVRDGKDGAPSDRFAAGDLVRVTLTLDLPKERRYVAVTDPIPAGFEPVESWFATTAADLAKAAVQQDGSSEPSWEHLWQRGSFDHVERHDDRVNLFATRLSEGRHEFSYVVRATTAGTFIVAPSRAEEMYSPEVFGRATTQTIEVSR